MMPMTMRAQDKACRWGWDSTARLRSPPSPVHLQPQHNQNPHVHNMAPKEKAYHVPCSDVQSRTTGVAGQAGGDGEADDDNVDVGRSTKNKKWDVRAPGCLLFINAEADIPCKGCNHSIRNAHVPSNDCAAPANAKAAANGPRVDSDKKDRIVEPARSSFRRRCSVACLAPSAAVVVGCYSTVVVRARWVGTRWDDLRLGR